MTGRRISVSRERAIEYRLAAHHLAEPLPSDRLGEAAAIGLRERAPDGAGPALRARLHGLTADRYGAAVADGELVATYAMRGAVYVVPGDRVAMFAAGALPAGPGEARAALGNAATVVDDAGTSPGAALEMVTEAIADILGEGEQLTKGEVSEALHGEVPSALEPWCATCEAWHVPEALFRLGTIAAGSRVVRSRPTTFVAAAPPPSDHAGRRAAAVQLARLFVHLYGPTRPEQFAAWRGFASEDDATDDAAGFGLTGGDVVAAEFGGRDAWMLAEDGDVLKDPPAHRGVTLLPRDDPFTTQQDRGTLAPTKALQRRLWTTVGSTAVVLVDGALVGLWRGRKQGRRFAIVVDALEPLSRRARAALAEEADAYASFRGAEAASVEIAGP